MEEIHQFPLLCVKRMAILTTDISKSRHCFKAFFLMMALSDLGIRVITKNKYFLLFYFLEETVELILFLP